MSQPNWPGSAGQPALAARAAFARKSLQLPFASGNGEVDAPEILWGTGNPNGAVIGVVGDEFIQTDAAAGEARWFKMFGVATNTGWVSVSALYADRTLSMSWFAGATTELKVQ